MKLSKRIAFLFFLFLPILFFGGEAQAATINSISGTFSNNSSVTISGSEFGIKNPVAPYKYDNFQYGSDKIGQAVSVSASGGRNWNHFSSCASVGRSTPETGFRYSNAHPRYTGDISGWKFFGTNTTYDDCYQGTNYLTLNKSDGFDEVYWSMWLLSETNGQNAKVRNVKIANWNYNETNYPQGRWDFYPTQGSGSGHVYALSCGSENSNEWGVGASAFSYGAETWNRFEGSLVVGNPGVANGRYEVYKNANLLQTTGNVMIRNSASCPKPDTFFFTHYHDDIDTSYSPPAPEQNLYHGEIYFDITRARVELCNSSTWSARTHCEIQIPHTTWNNGQIQINVNQGSFTSGQTSYRYVIDANGNASNGYPVTIGGGSSATCSNCCSTTQTCPTAMTTVGSCTRCCATACQTASTDTTAPRVTAFTVTPTTLTVGASITANYTVTDNTALSRAELWRAPTGANCTDTVKTGCVWTQVTSANITGTSRTGTFTSSPTAPGTFYYGLHAVDAANNVGYESAAVRVTVNAATQTCTNCCSTTQTCPTAMTTVGSCTRCCATACQTAPNTGGRPSPLPAGGVFFDYFNDGEASNWDLLANAAISTEQHRSGSYAVKATHNSTVIVRKTFPNTSEFYSEYWYWISPTWSANYNLNGLKFAHIDANGSCVNPPVGVNLWFADNSWYLTGSSLAYPNTPGAWTGSAYDFSPDGGNYTQVRGAWFKIGIYARSNTSGNNDGILRYWIGEPNEDFDPNVKAPRYSSTAYRWNSSGTALFNCLWVVSNIEDSDANSYQYLDDVEIWNRLPGSSGTQTCSNCCSSTQTCPTAMTTVGTCTRCCATACQAASTDATAPRVTAFTITPTTLTVGASLTANYTVTDNTALS